jgi:hypothetical protein
MSALCPLYYSDRAAIAADPKKNPRWGTSITNAPFPTQEDHRTVEFSMSSKNQTRSLHGNKPKPHSDLARHYQEIGIKAVAAVACAGARLAAVVRESNREKKVVRESNPEKKDRTEEETDG